MTLFLMGVIVGLAVGVPAGLWAMSMAVMARWSEEAA